MEINFYMDNLFKSVPSLLEVNLLSLGGFRLTKWISNDKHLLNATPVEERAQSVRTIEEEGNLPAERALGVIWNHDQDQDQAKGVGRYTAERYQSHSFEI